MKAQELRLGNWVLDPVIKKPIVIYDGSDLDKASGYQHIPLTEEWLIKFGFEKVESDDFSPNFFKEHKEAFVIFEDDMSVAVTCTKETYYLKGQYSYYAPSTERTKYVHQLQNLYFALTGTELQIKQ